MDYLYLLGPAKNESVTVGRGQWSQRLSSPSKAAAGKRKGKAEITRVLVYILSLSQTEGSNHSVSRCPPSFNRRLIFSHRRYLCVCSLHAFLFRLPSEDSFGGAQSWGRRGRRPRVPPVIDLGDITVYIFLFSLINNISLTRKKWEHSSARDLILRPSQWVARGSGDHC